MPRTIRPPARRHFVTCCLFVVALIGCGPSGSEKYTVTGTVTFDGQPVPDGHIIFAPTEPGSAPDAGKIIQGKFELTATAGKKRVEIHASRESGPIDPVMGAVPRVPYIPARYNSASVLTAEVTKQGPRHLQFDLQN
jgi:hypothetical protein